MDLVLFVFALAALTLLAGVAWYGALREQREGMRPNLVRASALTALAVLAFVAPFAMGLPVSSPSSGASSARDELRAIKGHLDAARQGCPAQREHLDAIGDALGLDALSPAEPPPAATTTTVRAPIPRLVLVALFVLLAVACVVLYAGGDRSTLPLRALWRRLRGGGADAGEAESAVSRAAAFATTQQYAQALEALAQVETEGLATFALLDLLFLRAHCAASLGIYGDGAQKGVPADRKERFAAAERDIEQLLRLAPEMAEALYLRAVMRALLGRNEDALKDFQAARPRLEGQSLPFDANESACLLELGAEALESADADKAAARFAEVASRKVLAAQVPLAHVAFRLGQVQRALRAGKLDEVRAGLRETRATSGLDDALQRRLALVCDVYDVLVVHREGDPARSSEVLRAFLAKHVPSDMPAVNEETAEEYLDDPSLKDRLALPAAVYRSFYFFRAVASARRFEAERGAPGEAAVGELVELLLRAMQFSPRNREALAGLGAIYYWFVAGRRAKGREWLRAATAMGVRSAVVRRLLDDDRRVEAERKQSLDAFLGASMRFLTDPTVKPLVRRQLIEELGRFQEFQPLLLELGERAAQEPQALTLDVLRERTAYIAGLVTDTGRRRTDARALKSASDEYRSAADTLTRTVEQLEGLEKRVFAELGRSLLE